jgi:hypothetical protein
MGLIIMIGTLGIDTIMVLRPFRASMPVSHYNPVCCPGLLTGRPFQG